MKLASLFGVAAACLVGMAVVAAADDATTKPSGQDATQAPSSSHSSKIVAPFNLLTDLTDDQKDQIKEIHKAEKAAEKELRTKEHDDIMGILTDDQKKELADTLAKNDAEKKSEGMEKRADADEQKAKELREKAADAAPATQPSGGN